MVAGPLDLFNVGIATRICDSHWQTYRSSFIERGANAFYTKCNTVKWNQCFSLYLNVNFHSKDVSVMLRNNNFSASEGDWENEHGRIHSGEQKRWRSSFKSAETICCSRPQCTAGSLPASSNQRIPSNGRRKIQWRRRCDLWRWNDRRWIRRKHRSQREQRNAFWRDK